MRSVILLLSVGLIPTVLLMALGPLAANASPVSFVVEGTANFVSPQLSTAFKLGDPYRLEYTFESTTPDSNASPNRGDYHNSISGLKVTVGTYTASPTFTSSVITVFNDLSGQDLYRIDLIGVSGPSAAGLPLGNQTALMQLIDLTGTAFTSDALPTAPLDPSDFVSGGGGTFVALAFDTPGMGQVFVSAPVERFSLPGVTVVSTTTTLTASSNVTTASKIAQTSAGVPLTVGKRVLQNFFGPAPISGPVASRALPIASGNETGQSAGDSGTVRLGSWVSIGSANVSNDFATVQSSSDIVTVLVGADIQPTDDLVMGFAVSYEEQDTTTVFNAGTQDSESITLLPYVGYKINDTFSADLSLGFTRTSIDQTRTLTGKKISSHLHSNRIFGAANLNAFYSIGDLSFSPSVGYLYVRDTQSDFIEDTGIPGGLRNGSRKVYLGQGRAGFSLGYFLNGWEPFVNAYLVHDFKQTPIVVGAGQARPPVDKTELQVGFGITYVTEQPELYASVEVNRAYGREDTDSHSISAVLRMDF